MEFTQKKITNTVKKKKIDKKTHFAAFDVHVYVYVCIHNLQRDI